MPEKNRVPAVLRPIGYDILGTPATEVAKETEIHTPLRARTPGQHENSTVTMVVQSVALRGRDGGATAELGGEQAGTLRASGGGGDKPYVLAPIPIDMRQASRGGTMTNNRPEGSSGGAPGTGVGQPGDPSPTLSGSHMPAIAFSCKDYGAGAVEDLAPTMRASMAVRRLMPIECHYLQGFPGDWCAVPTGPKGDRIAADGPQYKQLGNSWAVNHARWVGYRIAMWLAENPPRPVIEMEFDEVLLIWAMAD